MDQGGADPAHQIAEGVLLLAPVICVTLDTIPCQTKHVLYAQFKIVRLAPVAHAQYARLATLSTTQPRPASHVEATAISAIQTPVSVILGTVRRTTLLSRALTHVSQQPPPQCHQLVQLLLRLLQPVLPHQVQLLPLHQVQVTTAAAVTATTVAAVTATTAAAVTATTAAAVTATTAAVSTVAPTTAGSSCSSMPFCAECSSSTNCTACQNPGYYGFSTTGPGCQDCSGSNSGCTKCTTLARCDKCADSLSGPVSSTTTAQCAPCSASCNNCTMNGAGQCDSGACYMGYGLQSDNTCVQCTDPACAYCDGDVTVCQQCMSGYTIDPSTGQCASAAAPQIVLPGDGDVNAVSNANTGACQTWYGSICTKCRMGYGTPSDTDRSGCIACNSNYGCLDCSTVTQCTECNSTTLGPRTDLSGQCGKCASNCKVCDRAGANKCDVCAAGYFINSDDQTCKACDTANCELCDSGYCTNCKSGYILDTTTSPAKCIACGRGCAFCYGNPGKCNPSYCQSGFVYVAASQSCEFPGAVVVDGDLATTMGSSGSGTDSGKIIGIVVGVSVAVFIITALLMLCCCCMQQRPMSAMPVSDYNSCNNYQYPSGQQRPWRSSYGPTSFQHSPCGNDYIKRFQPTTAYGGCD